jgi:hypothetical protein
MASTTSPPKEADIGSIEVPIGSEFDLNKDAQVATCSTNAVIPYSEYRINPSLSNGDYPISSYSLVNWPKLRPDKRSVRWTLSGV